MDIEPVLGSTLYEAHLAKENTSIVSKLKPGLQKLNEALDGGLDYGTISCLSAESNTILPEVVFDTAIAHLLSHPEARLTAVLHATSNAFDIRKLRDHLIQALIKKGAPRETAKQEAFEVLKRVILMRVFDFVGMSEAVCEFREHLEEQVRNAAQETITPVPAGKSTIPDSQSDDEGEALQPSPPPTESKHLTPEPPQAGFLLIDSFSSLIQPVLNQRESSSQGLVILTSFMRSLRHLTCAYNICTLLVCSTEEAKEEQSSPSIFSSCTARPRLGVQLSALIDLHILIHLVPKTAQDAKAHFSTQPSHPNSPPRLTSVLEILEDRHSSRQGQWTFIETIT